MPQAQAIKTKPQDLLPQLIKQYPKIDFKKFTSLVQADYSSYELAAEFGITQNMAWKIRTRLNDINQGLTYFKDNKLTHLLSQQYQAIALQAKLIEFYLQDSEFEQLNNKEKILLLNATNTIAGTLEDKQHMIVNVSGNLSINHINISDTEADLLQGKTIEVMAIDALKPVNNQDNI